MKYRKTGKWALLGILICMFALIPGGEARAAGPLMQILVKDGYTAQTINFYYGRNSSGYTGFYADTPAILVHPKAKKVRFSARSLSGSCGDVSFQHSSMTPTENLQGNLMSYTGNGRRRAYFFSVKKMTDPKITYLKLRISNKKSEFIPKGKRYLEIRTKISSEVSVPTEICITDPYGKIAFYKKCKPGKNKTYTYRWNGKASRKNDLGLSKNDYVPAGTYKVSVLTTLKMKKYEKTVIRTKKVKVGGKIAQVLPDGQQ